MALVVDASALVELLIRSPAGDAVEEAVLSDEAFAPELLDIECASALASLERRGIINGGRAHAALRVLLRAPITRTPHAPLIEVAWRHRANLSLYDAAYVSLAQRLDAPLLTADRRLAAGPGLGVPITLLPA